MNPFRRDQLLPYRLGLRLVSLRVPRAQRADWLAEWEAELWHAAAAIALYPCTSPGRHRAVLSFCRGALADAGCLHHLEAGSPQEPHSRVGRAGSLAETSMYARSFASAWACLATLALLAAVAGSLAVLLPGVRSAVARALHAYDRGSVYRIQPTDSPIMTLRTLRDWQHRSQQLFPAFAFAQPVRKAIHIRPGNSPEIAVARGSANLLALLHVPLSHAVAPARGSEQLPTLVLTHRLWQQRFGARADALGRMVHIGLQPAWVGGIVAEDTLPAAFGQPDAILLLPQPVADGLAGNAHVLVFGRVAAEAPMTAAAAWWRFSVPGAPSEVASFDCTSPWSDESTPWQLLGFALLLALLSLPAVTSVSFGEVPHHGDNPCAGHRRRWLFLLLKLPLALAAASFFSLDLAFVVPVRSPYTAQYVLLLAGFTSSLFALQWVLRDQRRRCPACLRVLTCPARVGRPSRNFLDWNGTELICKGGHGLLHIPDLPTSWFSHPRWLTLDPSWQSLFAETA